MDNTSQLINYIVQELKRGVPAQSIRSALLQNGWPTEPVERAFVILRQNDMLATAPPSAELPDIRDSAAAQPAVPSMPATVQEAPPLTVPEKSSTFRKIAFVVLALLVLTGGGLVAFSMLNNPDSPATRDEQRKESLSRLQEKLTDYYTAKKTYPTRNELNQPIFASVDRGIDITDYRDPLWTAEAKACKNEQGKVVIAETRSKGCFGYRTTAANGDDCNATSIKCTRVVLSATLESGKPYILALDRNERE